jgi:site-specific recombinase XerD
VAVLCLLYGTGLRRGELERLDLEDWKREENLLQIDGRKSGCERSVPLHERIGRCLEAVGLAVRRGLQAGGALQPRPLDQIRANHSLPRSGSAQSCLSEH